MNTSILIPCIAMVALTIVVWIRLYIERVGEMRRRKIKPQDLSATKKAATMLDKQNASDNFKNLFEIPVLFYLLCIMLYVTQNTTPLFLTGAWLFVLLRVIHSFIHCTYNHVIHRFITYSISTLLIFSMWGMFATGLING